MVARKTRSSAAARLDHAEEDGDGYHAEQRADGGEQETLHPGRVLRLLAPLAEVAEELIHRLGRLGVLGQEGKELRGDGDDVGAGAERLVDVGDVTDAAHDDLRPDAAFAEGPRRLLHHGPGVIADVLDAPVEEAHEVGAGQGGHVRLVEGHAASAVDHDVALAELGHDLELVPAYGHLDAEHRIAEGRDELEGLIEHLRGIVHEDLDGQRNLTPVAPDQSDDLVDVLREVGSLLLRQDRRVGGDARHEAARERFLDLRQVRRVHEELHDSPLVRVRMVATASRRSAARWSGRAGPSSGPATRMVTHPAARPASTSRYRSPTMKERATSTPHSRAAWRRRPGLGLRQSQPWASSCGQT